MIVASHFLGEISTLAAIGIGAAAVAILSFRMMRTFNPAESVKVWVGCAIILVAVIAIAMAVHDNTPMQHQWMVSTAVALGMALGGMGNVIAQRLAMIRLSFLGLLGITAVAAICIRELT